MRCAPAWAQALLVDAMEVSVAGSGWSLLCLPAPGGLVGGSDAYETCIELEKPSPSGTTKERQRVSNILTFH